MSVCKVTSRREGGIRTAIGHSTLAITVLASAAAPDALPVVRSPTNHDRCAVCAHRRAPQYGWCLAAGLGEMMRVMGRVPSPRGPLQRGPHADI